MAIFKAGTSPPSGPVRIDNVRWHPAGNSGTLGGWTYPISAPGPWFERVNGAAQALDQVWAGMSGGDRAEWDAFAILEPWAATCPECEPEALDWWCSLSFSGLGAWVTAGGQTVNKANPVVATLGGTLWYREYAGSMSWVEGHLGEVGMLDDWALPPAGGYSELWVGSYQRPPGVMVANEAEIPENTYLWLQRSVYPPPVEIWRT